MKKYICDTCGYVYDPEVAQQALSRGRAKRPSGYKRRRSMRPAGAKAALDILDEPEKTKKTQGRWPRLWPSALEQVYRK